MVTRSPIDKIQLKVRMQEKLRAQLEEAAKANGVSLNQEIVNRLDASFTTRFAETTAALAEIARFKDADPHFRAMRIAEENVKLRTVAEQTLSRIEEVQATVNQLLRGATVDAKGTVVREENSEREKEK